MTLLFLYNFLQPLHIFPLRSFYNQKPVDDVQTAQAVKEARKGGIMGDHEPDNQAATQDEFGDSDPPISYKEAIQPKKAKENRNE